MKLLLLAGEESGVMYAERIRAEVLRRCPGAEIRGYGYYGFKTEDLAVMGFGQVIRRIFYFLRVERVMKRRAVDGWRPDVVCTVDYPGMNLRLSAYAKAKGVKTVHVVCPQVWAWRRGRIPKIERSTDRLCCFFPFEPALFRTGFAEFVGHPLAEDFRRAYGGGRAGNSGGVVAMLPGSRIGEIEKHVPVMLEAAAALSSGPSPIFRGAVVMPAANEKAFEVISRAVARSGVNNVKVVAGGAREVLKSAAAAVVASGTATLEAALAGCPTVLVYRVGWLFAAVARIVIRGVKHIGLVNIIAEKAGAPCPMPELLQKDFTAAGVVARLKPWLSDESAAAAARKALADTVALLDAGGDAVGRIAQFLM
ncbi:MAG: hypothetical protein J6T01_05955 [Kiritimatiellae bacterium]|nr:hypothetical protein [Kiritimatiellia bacterium]